MSILDTMSRDECEQYAREYQAWLDDHEPADMDDYEQEQQDAAERAYLAATAEAADHARRLAERHDPLPVYPPTDGDDQYPF